MKIGGRVPGTVLATDVDERLLNRELSWLDYNARVLELAADPAVPLLERVRMCKFFSSNLDEFFMVRVAGLQEQADAGIRRAPRTDARRSPRSRRSGRASWS